VLRNSFIAALAAVAAVVWIDGTLGPAGAG
jgi:hypothetical protein